MIAVTLPLRTVNELNGSHSHWRVVSKRRKHIRAMSALMTPVAPLPCVVRMTRVSAGELDDDGLRAALKSVRDGIADRLGVKDNDKRVAWLYGQAKCRRGQFCVRVEIEEQQ